MAVKAGNLGRFSATFSDLVALLQAASLLALLGRVQAR
jgi:hypothetical protein